MLGSGHTHPMPLDLTDDEKVALIELLRDTIERSRFLLSPQISKRPLLSFTTCEN